MMRVVLMGPPGAGKGTQAKRLAEKSGMVHLSSGDILRAERGSGSRLGRKLKTYMDAGELVPDEIVVEVMAGAIAATGAAGGLLLDGFPRTAAQAQALDGQLAALGRPLEAVLVIDLPDELAVERIAGRRSCGGCGRAYHLKYMPPARPGRCDCCGGRLVQRDDDTEAVVRRRLQAYRRQTEPVIAHYAATARRVIRVGGDATADEMTGRIAQALGIGGASA